MYTKTLCAYRSGNAKTAKVINNENWKRAKVWIKKDGNWKRAVAWAKTNTWKRSI